MTSPPDGQNTPTIQDNEEISTIARRHTTDLVESTEAFTNDDKEINNIRKEEPTSKRKKNISKSAVAARDALAGAAAGAFAKTAVAPIERVKLLLQLQNSLKKNGPGGGSSSSRVYSGAWDAAKSVYREQGILAFWRGNTPNVIRQGGASALNFMLMDYYKLAISPVLSYYSVPSSSSSSSSPQKQHELYYRRSVLLSSFLSGGLAGGTTTTVLYPVEFMRTRLAMDVGSNGAATATDGGVVVVKARLYPNGMKDVLRQTLHTDGIRGLYQGYGIALTGVVLYRALHLGGYDAMKAELVHHLTMKKKKQLQKQGQQNRDTVTITEHKLSMKERFVVAQSISIAAGTFCYPIDSVRRRLMMQAGVPKKDRLYQNSLDCFHKVMRTEGIRGFYLGLAPNIVRSFGGALLLVGYDVFRGMMLLTR